MKIYVNGFPKSGTTWVVRLMAYSLGSYAYGNGFKDSAFDEYWDNKGDYYIIHSHSKDISEYGSSDWKMIYIIRDFRDVIISSFFHHYGIDEDQVLLSPSNVHKKKIRRWLWGNLIFKIETYKIIRSWGSLSGGSSIIQFILGLLRLNWIKDLRHSSIGSWSTHVNFWTKGCNNVAVIRYEDLLQDTEGELTKAMKRLGVPVSIEKIQKAVSVNQFDSQKKLFQKKSEEEKAKHLRRGISGDWVRFLNKNTIRIIRDVHGETMNKNGYKI